MARQVLLYTFYQTPNKSIAEEQMRSVEGIKIG
jgi:hypothetical protein